MIDQIFSLILFAVLSTGSPGGATSLATASGAQFGFVRSLPLIGGIALSLALLIAVSGTGLSTALLAIPSLEIGMKAIGTGYLLWLAFVIMKAGPPQRASLVDKKPIGFVGGALLLVINPKAWAMAVSVAGAFTSISHNAVTLALILGTVFAMAAIVSLCTWTLAGSFLARVLTADWQWHLFNAIMASLLIAAIVSFWA